MDPVAGWKSRAKETLEIRKCPACGDSTNELFGVDEGFACCQCGGSFPLSKWTIGKAKKQVADCAQCGERIVLTVANLSAGLYLCQNPKCCQNVVAIQVGSRTIHPQSVLSVKWGKSIRRRSQILPGSIY